MSKDKPFDCVDYKRSVQERHAEEQKGLSAEERIRLRAEWLEKSDNPAAKAWRMMCKKNPASCAK
jgi:hypothetical protein